MPNIGFCMVNPAPEIHPGHVVQVARKCEEIGLHSMWALDRVVYDNLEPPTLLTAAAAVTSKIRLGTSVLLAALRPPAVSATWPVWPPEEPPEPAPEPHPAVASASTITSIAAAGAESAARAGRRAGHSTKQSMGTT